MKEVIDPCLNSQAVSAEVKAHLEAKKKSLATFKTVYNITKAKKSYLIEYHRFIPEW